MKTAVITDYGDIDVVDVQDRPRPEPKPGEVLVAVIASSINPVDTKFRTPGARQQVTNFPAILGWDLAGIVVSAPEHSRWNPGEWVIAMHPPTQSHPGSWAQYVAVPDDELVAAPTRVDLSTAASLPLSGLTADQALGRLDLHRGERLLITGAAGAVGGIAVQLAASRGIDVTGLVSRPEHIAEVLRLGASTATADVDQPSDFDAVVDTAGIVNHPEFLRSGGRLITIDDQAVIPADLTEKASLAAHNFVRQDATALEKLANLVDMDSLTPRVAETYHIDDIRQAHDRFERGGLLGKIVLLM